MAMMAIGEVLPRVLAEVAQRVDHVAQLAAESRRAFAESAEWARVDHAGADRVAALLADARWCLSDPMRWVRRGASARGDDGAPLCATDPAATGWSAIGALEKALIDRHYVTDARLGWLPAYHLVSEAAWTMHGALSGQKIGAKSEAHEAIAFVEVWADGCSHERLLEGFDRAIARRVSELARRAAR
jgi:hypothetical protein